MTAFVQDPNESSRFWVAGAGGVFRTEDGGASFTELGDRPTSDRSACRSAANTTVAAVAGTPAKLYRFDGTTWPEVVVPTGIGESGHVLVVDAEHVVLGTSTGVWRFTEGASTPWSQVFTGGVVGAPVGTTTGPISWLTAGGGVIRSTDGGAHWDPVAGTATPVAHLTQFQTGGSSPSARRRWSS